MPDPKIEPWMVAAVKEVIEAEDEGHLFRTIRNEMEATEGRRAGTDRDATQRTYEALAAIIARHAPGPAKVPSRQPEWIEQIRRENRERIEQDFEGKLSEAEGPLMQVIDELLTHIDFTTDPASVPIGPGDVVQVVSETHARSWLGIVREKYDNGKWFVVGYGCADTHELTRIGRAKYWPDGSKVEEGK